MEFPFNPIRTIDKNDPESVERFIEENYINIYRYCYTHINNKSDAEDITQETFLRFFNSLERYKEVGKPLNYLYVIARNACKDFYKKKIDTPVEEVRAETSHEMGNIDVKIDIRNALDKLPEEIREVAILFYFQDLKQRDIAKILSIGLPLVKYRLKRAKELLAEYLE